MAQGGHGIRPDHPERPAEFANRGSSLMLSQAANAGLADNFVSTSPQAFHDNALAAVIGLRPARRRTGQRANNGATQGLILIRFAQDCAKARANRSRGPGVAVKLRLICGQRLTFLQVGVIGRGRLTIQHGLIFRPLLRAGGNSDQQGQRQVLFHRFGSFGVFKKGSMDQRSWLHGADL